MDIKNLEMRRHAPHLIAVLQNRPEWTHGAEIGVATGRTLNGVLQECPNLHMIAVDAFAYVEDSEQSGMYRDLPHEDNEETVRAIAEAYPGRVTVLKGLSHVVAREVPDASLDFVFIDASHMYVEVKRDLLAWIPKVKDDGWIMGHDYCPRWKGVCLAVDEVLGVPLELPEAIWAFPKGDL